MYDLPMRGHIQTGRSTWGAFGHFGENFATHARSSIVVCIRLRKRPARAPDKFLSQLKGVNGDNRRERNS